MAFGGMERMRARCRAIVEESGGSALGIRAVMTASFSGDDTTPSRSSGVFLSLGLAESKRTLLRHSAVDGVGC